MLKIGRLNEKTSSIFPDASNPLGLMAHCHRKIETHLESLEKALEIFNQAKYNELPRAFGLIDAACLHLTGPGVKHTQDEEISLFPRIRLKDKVAGNEVLAAMEELQAQHQAAKKLEAELFKIAENLPRNGQFQKTELENFARIVGAISLIYRPHIILEDSFVFPLAAKILNAEDIAELGSEIIARRRLNLHRT